MKISLCAPLILSFQTLCSPSTSGWLCLQPHLVAPHLLSICSNLWHPADFGWCGSLPALLQPQSGATQPQCDWELHSSQSLHRALIVNQDLLKLPKLQKCLYHVFILIKPLLIIPFNKAKHLMFLLVDSFCSALLHDNVSQTLLLFLSFSLQWPPLLHETTH